jgi:hypothetical protein
MAITEIQTPRQLSHHSVTNSFKYLGKIDFIFKGNLVYESRYQVSTFDEI